LDLAGEWQHVRRKPAACQVADIKLARDFVPGARIGSE
jgi:hypothetical protein